MDIIGVAIAPEERVMEEEDVMEAEVIDVFVEEEDEMEGGERLVNPI